MVVHIWGKKYSVVVVISTVVVAFILLYILFVTTVGNVYRLNATGITGKVRETQYGWGIASAIQTISVTNLPQDLQKDGTKVYCNVTITDVIGSGKWDAFASVSNCERR